MPLSLSLSLARSVYLSFSLSILSCFSFLSMLIDSICCWRRLKVLGWNFNLFFPSVRFVFLLVRAREGQREGDRECHGGRSSLARGAWLSACRALINERAAKVVARVAASYSFLIFWALLYILLFVYALTVRCFDLLKTSPSFSLSAGHTRKINKQPQMASPKSMAANKLWAIFLFHQQCPCRADVAAAWGRYQVYCIIEKLVQIF